MFLRLLYYFFKVFGLATIHVDTRCLTFTHSKLSVVYNAFLITLTILISFITIEYVYTITWLPPFEKIYHTVQLLSLFISTIIVLALHCARQSKIIKMSTNLCRILISLRNFCHKRNSELLLEHKLKKVYFLDIFILVAVLATSFTSADPSDFYILTISTVVFSFLIHCVVIQYGMVLIIIFCTFRTINSYFQDIYKKPIMRKDTLFILDYETDNESVQTTMRQFSHLRSLYLSLHSITTDVSSFYAIPMLLSVHTIFMVLTLYIYYCSKAIMYQVEGIPVIVYYNSFMWTLLFIFTLLVVTKSASATVAEVKQMFFFIFFTLHSFTSLIQY